MIVKASAETQKLETPRGLALCEAEAKRERAGKDYGAPGAARLIHQQRETPE